MAYRERVTPLTKSSQLARFVAAFVALAVFAVACGGSASSSGSDADSDSAETITAAATAEPTVPEPTNTPVVIPTTTPPPSPTPLPTATALPLEAPTPSAVLLSTAFTNSSRVTTVGIDEVFFGMTPDEAAAAATTTWIELPSTSGNCFRVTPADGPEGVQLWIVDGFVERVDIAHPDLRTPSQLGLGNTAAELQGQLRDRLTIETAGEGAQVATFTPTDVGDRDFRLIFELEDDKVVRYRSGRVGIVERSEGSC